MASRRLCIHEAGHAVVAVTLSLDLLFVDVRPCEHAGGHCVTDSLGTVLDDLAAAGPNALLPRALRERAADQLTCALAGQVAEARSMGAEFSLDFVLSLGARGANDTELAMRLACAAAGRAVAIADENHAKSLLRFPEVIRELEEGARRADEILAAHWQELLAVADRLGLEESLFVTRVVRVMAGELPIPQKPAGQAQPATVALHVER